MLISDIMNVIVTKKAILDIWNNIDIRNTFSNIKNDFFLLVAIELLISGIYIFTSNNVIN